MELTISLAQMDVALGQPQVNLCKARELAAEARRRGSDVVLFPELWPTGYDLENAKQYATSLDEGLFVELAALARENAIHICGSLLSWQDRRYYNTAPLFSPAGKCLGHYSKTSNSRRKNEHQKTSMDHCPGSWFDTRVSGGLWCEGNTRASAHEGSCCHKSPRCN